MTSFPSSVKTFSTLVDDVDNVLAAHPNERGDEITAIETYLLGVTASTVTTSNVTLTKNSMNVLTIAGLTANRNAVLPSPSAAGQYLYITLADGDDTYFMVVIGDTGVTINGGSAATEFLRIQTKGRTLGFRSSSTSNWQCISGAEEIEKNAIVIDTLQPMSTTGTIGSAIGRPMRLTKIDVSYYIVTTNNGSNYWTIAITNAAGTTIATSVNTSAGSANTWSRLAPITSFSQQNLTASDVYLKIVPSKSGSPGNAYFIISVTGILA